MRCRLLLEGSGTDADPYHVDLPTYTLVEVDYSALLAVVDLPDADCPEVILRAELPMILPRDDGFPFRVVPLGLRRQWQTHLEARYAGSGRRYNPMVG